MSPTVARGRSVGRSVGQTEGRAGVQARGSRSAHGGDCNSHFCAVKVFEAGCSLQESIGVIKEESYLEAPALVPVAAVSA